ncbi:hypothetical protein AYI69_g6743 [Smittium culicis]|uniref:Uncharacterized protein n=1 Tax=Smittium culicis TaxID=133412 RepID=A0A1R1XX58_9FUNG|nr:hypothetical protein AYI69_g6743 [Smittium culicis]
MSEIRYHPIQTVTDQETRLVANVGKTIAIQRVCEELGISSVFLRTSTARERAFIKFPASKTWISDLINKTIKAQKINLGNCHLNMNKMILPDRRCWPDYIFISQFKNKK